MFEVRKYKLSICDEQVIKAPAPARPLSIIVQDDIPILYMLVNPKEKVVRVTIIMHGTGYEFEEEEGSFLGTVSTLNGALIWHVWTS